MGSKELGGIEMSKGIEERIIEEISKTGFPLELRVSELLNKSDYYVANNLYYVDLDENKGREIDLRALKNLIFDRYFVRHCLLIECKKSEDKPWVIFSSPITSYDSEYFAVPYAGMDIDRYPPSEFYPFDALESIHPFCKYPRRGRSFFEPFKNKEASETIFKAIMTSVKASSAMRNGSFAAGSESVCFY